MRGESTRMTGRIALRNRSENNCGNRHKWFDIPDFASFTLRMLEEIPTKVTISKITWKLVSITIAKEIKLLYFSIFRNLYKLCEKITFFSSLLPSSRETFIMRRLSRDILYSQMHVGAQINTRSVRYRYAFFTFTTYHILSGALVASRSRRFRRSKLMASRRLNLIYRRPLTVHVRSSWRQDCGKKDFS